MSFAQNALWLKLTNVKDRFYANKCPRSQKYSSFRVGREASSGEGNWETRYMCNSIFTLLSHCCCFVVRHKFKFILLKEEKLGNIFYRRAYLSSCITSQILFILLMAIEKCVAFYFWSIRDHHLFPFRLMRNV